MVSVPNVSVIRASAVPLQLKKNKGTWNCRFLQCLILLLSTSNT